MSQKNIIPPYSQTLGGDSWVVAKFGGTSVALPERWDSIRQLLLRHRTEGHRSLVVCSALAGITDQLEKLLALAGTGADPGPALAAIWERHVDLATRLNVDADSALSSTMSSLRTCAETIAERARLEPHLQARLMAHGELLSTRLGVAYLKAQGCDVAFADARDMLRARPAAAETPPGTRYLSAVCDFAADPHLRARLSDGPEVVVTQGFIASDAAGDTVLLGRGGSDTSAAYLASKLEATRLEIWTDVPGMFSANPGAVPTARLVPELGYREAQTLAGLGAKVLHPRCLRALAAQHIPLHLGSTEHPQRGGTRINGTPPRNGIRAIVSRKGLCLLTMRRPAEWQPVGFMAEVSTCFQRHGISMDLVSSSPSEIRATVDTAACPDVMARLDALLRSLRQVCHPELTPQVASVSLVGHRPLHDADRHATVARMLADEDVRLVVHAADEAHLTYVVDASAVDGLVAKLHAALFAEVPESLQLGPPFRQLMKTSQTGAPRPAVPA